MTAYPEGFHLLRRQRRYPRYAGVSVQKQGNIRFGASIWETMGEPSHIQFLAHETDRKMAIFPCDPVAISARKVSFIPNGTCTVSGLAALKEFGLVDPPVAQHLDFEFVDGVLILSLPFSWKEAAA